MAQAIIILKLESSERPAKVILTNPINLKLVKGWKVKLVIFVNWKYNFDDFVEIDMTLSFECFAHFYDCVEMKYLKCKHNQICLMHIIYYHL